MAENPYEFAPARLCDSCGAVDGHPRHVYGVEGNEAEQVTYDAEFEKKAIELCAGDSVKLTALIRDLRDSATQAKHFDCCLADGCPDGTCQVKLDDADDPFDGGKTTGLALSRKLAARVEALTKNQES